MHRRRLTDFDQIPESMEIYMRYYGPHFNRKLMEFAVSLMTKEENGEEKPIKPYSKEEVDRILMQSNIKLKNNSLYDYVYVANMCKADFLGSSISDEHHVALYIKNVVDDVDAEDGLIFNRWYADTCYLGIPVDWEEML